MRRAKMHCYLLCFSLLSCILLSSATYDYNNLRANGSNVCSFARSKMVNVQVSTTANTLVRTVKRVPSIWGWRQTTEKIFYRLQTKTLYHMVTREKKYYEYYCCSGWSDEQSGNTECNTPVCDNTCLNGGRCVNPNTCSCAVGFEGEYCQNDVNECKNISLNTCDHLCANTRGGFSCHCMDGFKLHSDGRTCVDIDECSLKTTTCSCPPGDRNCDAMCVNTPGSYSCQCSPGYTLGYDGMCKDRDECIEGYCQHKCMNTPGSYMCSCFPGFQVNETSGDCYDIDECLIDNGGCSQRCHNVLGGSVCSCNDSFYLTDDFKTCRASDLHVKNTLICSNNYEIISCPWPRKIEVLYVFYGRLSSDVCPAEKSKTGEECSADGAVAVIANLCGGQSTCFVPDSAARSLKDPCPDTEKYLHVFYKCS